MCTYQPCFCVGIALLLGMEAVMAIGTHTLFSNPLLHGAIQTPVTDLCQTSSPRSNVVDHDATQTFAMIYILVACLLLHLQTA